MPHLAFYAERFAASCFFKWGVATCQGSGNSRLEQPPDCQALAEPAGLTSAAPGRGARPCACAKEACAALQLCATGNCNGFATAAGPSTRGPGSRSLLRVNGSCWSQLTCWEKPHKSPRTSEVHETVLFAWFRASALSETVLFVWFQAYGVLETTVFVRLRASDVHETTLCAWFGASEVLNNLLSAWSGWEGGILTER